MPSGRLGKACEAHPGADYGDWHTSSTPMVQDAFGTPGALANLGPVEKTALDVTGYDIKAAVPEPESYAMMLLGLGVLGGVGRRRARAAKAVNGKAAA